MNVRLSKDRTTMDRTIMENFVMLISYGNETILFSELDDNNSKGEVKMKDLFEMENTVVNLRTQEEYNEFMKMRNKVDWNNPSFYPGHYGKQLCVRVQEYFNYDKINYYEEVGVKILTLCELKEILKDDNNSKGEVKMKRFENAEVGDKVYCRVNGKGEILCVDPPNDGNFPINVEFYNENHLETYTVDGEFYLDSLEAVLFYRDENSNYLKERPIPKPDLTKLKVDDRILVSDHKDGDFVKRHFSHVGANGKATCFRNGNTSWSSDHSNKTAWNFWKLPEEE